MQTMSGSNVARSSGATSSAAYSPGREAVHGGLRALARVLRLRVHAFAERARAEHVRRLLEAERGDAERADAVLARERDHPAVAPRHVDDLAVHAQLLEVARRTAGALGDRLAGPQHADRDGNVCGRTYVVSSRSAVFTSIMEPPQRVRGRTRGAPPSVLHGMSICGVRGHEALSGPFRRNSYRSVARLCRPRVAGRRPSAGRDRRRRAATGTEAARHWSRAVSLQPDSAYFNYMRGAALARLGHRHAAAEGPASRRCCCSPSEALAQQIRSELATLSSSSATAAREPGARERRPARERPRRVDGPRDPQR